MESTLTARVRQPYDVRDLIIYAGPTDNDAMIGEVYDNGQPHPAEMAKVWAWSFPIMFPALAQIRDASALAAYASAHAWPEEAVDLLRRIYHLAKEALPIPTIGDAKGMSPVAPSSAAPAVPAGWVTVPSQATTGIRARIESRAVDFGLDFDQHGGDEAIDALYRAAVAQFDAPGAAPVSAPVAHPPLGKVLALAAQVEQQVNAEGGEATVDRIVALTVMAINAAADREGAAQAQPSQDVTERAKAIAWEHHKVTHPASSYAASAETYWARRGGAERAAWFAAARAVPAPVADAQVVEAQRKLTDAVLAYAAEVDSFFDMSTGPATYNAARRRMREAIGALRAAKGEAQSNG